jgi:hypothetical protein
LIHMLLLNHGSTYFFNIQIMQQHKQNFLPVSFKNTWINNSDRQTGDFMLRNSNEINVPFARLSSSKIQPLINLPKLWTSFDDDSVKHLRNKLEFKLKLKELLLDQLSDVAICTRLFCPACLNPNLPEDE